MKYLLIAIVAGCLFVPFLGAMPLFSPNETGLAAAAREMLVSGRYTLAHAGSAPLYDTYPLFVWLQAGSMVLFGSSDFAARLPNAMIGIITLLTVYAIGKKQADSNLGIWWAIVLAGSWLPYLLFKSGLADPLYNYLAFLSVYFAYRIAYSGKPFRTAALSGLCLGLAVLTNGPAVVVIHLLTLLAYWISSKGKTGIRPGHIGILLLVACLPAAFWLVCVGLREGWTFAGNFCRHQAAILPRIFLRGPFYYWTFLPGCFPMGIFLFTYLQRRGRRSIYATPPPLDIRALNAWMWSMCWVILLVCPSTLYYLPLSFLAARQVYRVAEGRHSLRGWNIVLLLTTGIILGIALILLPVAGVYKQVLSTNIRDPFIRAYLEANIHWSLLEVSYGLIYILLVTLSCIALFRKKYQAGLLWLFLGTAIFIEVALLHFGPKVMAHAQQTVVSGQSSAISKRQLSRLPVLTANGYALTAFISKPYHIVSVPHSSSPRSRRPRCIRAAGSDV
ncbi:glycosyltransferase family 39 protein [uncultured Chitinophaga sp.]|jgi:4-amino-4-deoxy-L-arabinose transferase and related glycosyltransferases of PMT family|uniref:ArnT family glycosyltransferase n=1 Tax=uncultured Chitinophaga sp. TaxID=339340 RepID=UPI00262034C9|nr:glycosyltransferase family 39 protein [uncultured Chitinophaga sp.]